MILYKKYHPNSFEEIVAQEPVVKTLRNVVKKDMPFNAYLFHGASGTGKTVTARTFSRALNCERNVNGSPCNKCSSCISSFSRDYYELLEEGICINEDIEDKIEDLIFQISFFTFQLKYKLFLINSIKLINENIAKKFEDQIKLARNNVVFIFMTQDFESFPVKIKALCQCFRFVKPEKENVINFLNNICKSEELEISSEILYLIEVKAEGDLRRALILLEQIIPNILSGECNEDEISFFLGA